MEEVACAKALRSLWACEKVLDRLHTKRSPRKPKPGLALPYDNAFVSAVLPHSGMGHSEYWAGQARSQPSSALQT